MVDICSRCDLERKIDYIWFDTGLEYQATKNQLNYLEDRYGIQIRREKAIKSIPRSCKEYGVPFLSKRVSDNIKRLQRHDFQWEDKPYEELLKKYCTWNEKKKDWVGCKSALKWWCNTWGENSLMNIKRNKWLKEFLIAFPPSITISDQCCEYAKKKVIHRVIEAEGYELGISGIRKYEGGQRSTAYKSCFDENFNGESICDTYRPLFWYKNKDRKEYEKRCDICHSACYGIYGLQRTGCCGCPFGKNFDYELQVMEKYEPKLYKAAIHIFGKSYEYTRAYRKFYQEMNGK